MFPMGFSYKNTKKISANIDIILRVHHILKAKKWWNGLSTRHVFVFVVQTLYFDIKCAMHQIIVVF